MVRQRRSAWRAGLTWAAAATILLASAAYYAAARLLVHQRLAASRVIAAPSPKSSAMDRIAVQGAGTKVSMPDGSVAIIRTVLRTPNDMRFGQWVWSEVANGSGPLWIRVNLERQLISVFRGGDEIGTAVIIYGAENKATPKGLYLIRSKLREHRSSLYDADMPYTLGLTDDGIAIHASLVRLGTATHGCIGVPAGFARELFGAAEKGDRVLIDS